MLRHLWRLLKRETAAHIRLRASGRSIPRIGRVAKPPAPPAEHSRDITSPGLYSEKDRLTGNPAHLVAIDAGIKSIITAVRLDDPRRKPLKVTQGQYREASKLKSWMAKLVNRVKDYAEGGPVLFGKGGNSGLFGRVRGAGVKGPVLEIKKRLSKQLPAPPPPVGTGGGGVNPKSNYT